MEECAGLKSTLTPRSQRWDFGAGTYRKETVREVDSYMYLGGTSAFRLEI